ncbi:MAG: ECF-type sigma factor [Acidobacteriota bacterium]
MQSQSLSFQDPPSSAPFHPGGSPGHDGARDVTRHLQDLACGDDGAFDAVVALVYRQLERIAHRNLRHLRFGQTLDTRGLVHETYLKMLGQGPVSWRDRQHFFAVTSRAMRQILVDHARRRHAQKRGSGVENVELQEHLLVSADDCRHILQLETALEQLEGVDPQLRLVVEHRFFGGLTEAEIAQVLEVSERTVQRLWRRARIWLRNELG